MELMGQDVMDTGTNVLSGLNSQREQIQQSRLQVRTRAFFAIALSIRFVLLLLLMLFCVFLLVG